MAYTEIKERNGRKYFYRVKSVRKGKKVNKKRVYIGSNLNKKELFKREKDADKELMLLSSLLTEEDLKILKKVQKEYLSQPKGNLENRYETFCSLFTHDSTNIEGNTFTLQETSQLLFENITPRKFLREINEIINHREAFDYILKTKEDISRNLILKLHGLVVKNTLKPELEEQVGKYRKIQVYIRGAKWIPPKASNVPKYMATLISWHSKNKKKLHPLILAAYFHSVFESIHPFIDGNGRVGRLLINFILHKNKYPMINIPNKRKYKYYDVLKISQMKGDLVPFIDFLIRLLKEEKVRF